MYRLLHEEGVNLTGGLPKVLTGRGGVSIVRGASTVAEAWEVDGRVTAEVPRVVISAVGAMAR